VTEITPTRKNPLSCPTSFVTMSWDENAEPIPDAICWVEAFNDMYLPLQGAGNLETKSEV
jgi:hypothetical protein